MIGSLIELVSQPFMSQPIEGPISKAWAAVLRLVYQRGLLDGFLLGLCVALVFAVRLNNRCAK